MMLDALGRRKRYFELLDFKIVLSDPTKPDVLTGCLLKIAVGGSEALVASEGKGPVNAIDIALRKALGRLLSRAGRDAADRLYGARDRFRRRHRREGPRFGRVERQPQRMAHGRRLDRHHRGKLDCALRFHRLYARGRRRAGVTALKKELNVRE